MSGSPMSGYGEPQITGDWSKLDSSENSIEFAPTPQTAERGVLAMRFTGRPGAVTTITVAQIRNLPNAFQEGGKLAHLIEI